MNTFLCGKGYKAVLKALGLQTNQSGGHHLQTGKTVVNLPESPLYQIPPRSLRRPI